MVKKALLIGCNYRGTDAELDGCVNDVKRMRRCLLKLMGFEEENIKLLIDTDESYTQPTGANIRRCINRLVRGAKPGDVLFIHYSGHGTRVPADDDDDDDDTGYDECIVPCDMNLITDDDFREFVDKVPAGCSLTIVSDSCHSGGLIDKSKEQIGDSHKRDDGEDCDKLEPPPRRHRRQHLQPEAEEDDDGSCDDDAAAEDVNAKNRSLPLSTLIDILRQKTGKEDIGVGKIRPTLFDMFGEDASPKFKMLMEVMSKLRHGGDYAGRGGGLRSTVASLVRRFCQQKLEGTGVRRNKGVHSGATHRDKGVVYCGANGRSRLDNGILISGCQTDQTSANASATGRAGGAYGALSNAILAILGKADGEISNRKLVLRAGKMLARQGFPQRPGLYCSDHYVDAPFLC